MDAVREFLPFLPAGAGTIIYPLSILFFCCMAYGLYWRFQRYGVSLKDAWEEVKLDAKTEGRARLHTVIEQALLQKKVMRRPLAGNFHWGIFGAMLVFSAGTGLVAFQQDLLSKLGLTFLKNGVYFAFEFVLDTAALAFLAGLLVALGRRLFAKPSYLENNKESYAVLGLLLFIGATGLLLEGMRLAAHPVPWGRLVVCRQPRRADRPGGCRAGGLSVRLVDASLCGAHDDRARAVHEALSHPRHPGEPVPRARRRSESEALDAFQPHGYGGGRVGGKRGRRADDGRRQCAGI